MIEGLKITIKGIELKEYLLERVEYHNQKLERYREKIEGLEELQEQDAHTSVDPVRDLRNHMEKHHSKATYFAFLAEHLNVQETYLLAESDMRRIEIYSRYL